MLMYSLRTVGQNSLKRERESRISKMMWGSKVEAAEHSVPAQTGDIYFRALFKGHLRIKNNNKSWKYCQCLLRADEVIWSVAVLLLVEDKHIILHPPPRKTQAEWTFLFDQHTNLTTRLHA